MQTSPRSASAGPEGFDLGPSFVTDPFPQVRIVRRVLTKSQWRTAIEDLLDGCLHAGLSRLSVQPGEWGLSVLLMPFLDQLDRPIRALVGSIGADTQKLLDDRPRMDARRLPSEGKLMHDRVWLAGETGLLVGGSANTLLPEGGEATTRPTTAAPLPHGDTLAWRERFEAWWEARA